MDGAEPDEPADGRDGVLRRAFGLEADDVALVQACLDAVMPGALGGVAAALDRGTPLAQALDISPAVIEALYGRAFAQFDAGHTGRAEALFRTLCTLDGERADHWLGLGICARLREDYDAAQLAFSTASALRPDWAVPLFHMLEAHMRTQQFALAREIVPRVEAGFGELSVEMQDETVRFKLALDRQAQNRQAQR